MGKLDEKTLERMLAAQRDALAHAKPGTKPELKEATDQFDEYVRPAEPGDAPKAKGLRESGYEFPPSQPHAMTKANLAKGIAMPPAPKTKEPAVPPPQVKVEDAEQFEVYHRPDLDARPATGVGLRGGPAPAAPASHAPAAAHKASAKEILANYQPPEPQVFSPRRASATSAETPEPGGGPTPEHDAASLDADADLATAQELTMSRSRHHGPIKTVTEEDPFQLIAPLPGAKKDKWPGRAPELPADAHASDAPEATPGECPRIGLLQCEFNFSITSRMSQVALARARELGATVTHHIHAPGVYDAPLIAKALAARADVDALVVIGCILQGETGHDQLIAREVARKLADLAFDTGKPVGFAVTGPRMSRAAAEARIPMGRHAVDSVVKQWRTLRELGTRKALAR